MVNKEIMKSEGCVVVASDTHQIAGVGNSEERTKLNARKSAKTTMVTMTLELHTTSIAHLGGAAMHCTKGRTLGANAILEPLPPAK